jgi:hypothetical protein
MCFLYRFAQSFFRYNSFKNPVAALDVVHAATSLTELYSSVSNSGTNSENAVHAGDKSAASTAAALATAVAKVTSVDAFYNAYYCMGMRSDELLHRGIQAALSLQRVRFFFHVACALYWFCFCCAVHMIL